MKEWHQGRELLLPKELYKEMKENHALAEFGQSFQMDTPKEVPVYEKYVKNTQLNFGPQHPAAHGVLVRNKRLCFFSRLHYYISEVNAVI